MADSRTQIETIIQTGIDTALKELHTCMPALVTKVYKTDGVQLIDAQPTIKRKFKKNRFTKETLVDLPLLYQVPIRYIKTKTFSISVPIEVNDHVLIIFSERSIDNWLEFSGLQDPTDVRKHSLSDAFAYPMMYPQADRIPDFNNEDLVIKTNTGLTKIVMKKTENIEITGDIKMVDGIITGPNVFNGPASNAHGHNQGVDSALNTQVKTNSPS